MLFETIAIFALILPISVSSAWGIRNDFERKTYLWLQILGPIIDAWLVWYILTWMEFSFMAVWGCTMATGVFSNMLLQPMLSPRRLMVFRFSWQNIVRHKRQAALMMGGLLIASSIITSSLVIGDSLDRTMSKEVNAMYGDTDLLVYRQDLRTGFSFDMDENLSLEITDKLSTAGVIDSWSHGLESTIILANSDAEAIPSLKWYAYDGWSGVSINTVASEELGLEVGDVVELSWSAVADDGDLSRSKSNLTIEKIIPMDGIGAMSGTKSPAFFTSLTLSQELQSKDNLVNMLRLSLVEEGSSKSKQKVQEMIDDVIQYSDSGFEITTDSDTLSISNSDGLGRLESIVMDSWRENSTKLLGDGSAMEVLQIPLQQIHQNSNIIVLPDDRIQEIFSTEDGDWYISGGAVSFQKQRTGEAHGWKVPDGGIINDVSLMQNSILVAHSDGLIEVYDDNDIEPFEHISGEEILVAALFTQDLPPLPETIFSIDYLQENSTDWIAVKHLLGTEVFYYENDEWASHNISGEWLFFDEEMFIGSPQGWTNLQGESSPQAWKGHRNGLLSNDQTLYAVSQNNTPLSEIPSQCNALTYSFDGELLCSTNFGSLVFGESIRPRLPISMDIGSFGEMPQLILATDNDLSPRQGKLLSSSRLDLLNQSESILFTGLIPYAYGDSTPTSLKINGSISELNIPGLEELESMILGFVNISDGENLSSSTSGERNILVVNEGDTEAIFDWLNEISGTETMNLQIVAAKEDALQAAEEGAGLLSAMFLVFGAFTIGAGILLVLTIVLMLSETRRIDLATLRAIGLKKSDMRALSTIEGVITSSIASILGGIIGLLLAWLVSLGFTSVFNSVGADGIEFAFSSNSMLIGMSSGFIVAMITIWTTALWTSKLNIVEALKGVLPTKKSGVPWWMLLLIIAFIGAGLLSLLSTFTISSNSPLRHATWNVSVCLLIIGFIPIFTFVLPNVFAWKLRNLGSNTIAAIGISLFVWGLLPDSFAPVDNGVKPDEITFAIMGIIEVFAGVMILSSIAPKIVSKILQSKIFPTGFRSSAKLGLAYPSSTPLKTAVIMGMFSLTVFSVIVLAGYSVQFEEHSSGYVEDASGEFEILLSSSRQSPLEIPNDISEWGLNETIESKIDAVGKVNRAIVWIDDGEEKIGYILRGVDDAFIDHGAIPLDSWDPSLGDNEQDAWNAMKNNENIVFIDSSFSLTDPNTGESLMGINLPIGKSILLIDISNPGNSRTVTVGGILSESSQLFSAGVWMNGEIVDEQFGGVVTRIYVSHDGTTSSEIVEESISKSMAKEGVHSSIIEDEILILLGLIFAILAIFQAYLALGLFVGIAGIGVVTYRSVSERTNEIGMLRAIGFTKRGVLSGLLVEISWISVLGILNGVIVALMFHVALYNEFWKDQGAELILPWGISVSMLVVGWLLVIFATVIPITKATKVTPAEALSTVD